MPQSRVVASRHRWSQSHDQAIQREILAGAWPRRERRRREREVGTRIGTRELQVQATRTDWSQDSQSISIFASATTSFPTCRRFTSPGNKQAREMRHLAAKAMATSVSSRQVCEWQTRRSSNLRENRFSIPHQRKCSVGFTGRGTHGTSCYPMGSQQVRS